MRRYRSHTGIGSSSAPDGHEFTLFARTEKYETDKPLLAVSSRPHDVLPAAGEEVAVPGASAANAIVISDKSQARADEHQALRKALIDRLANKGKAILDPTSNESVPRANDNNIAHIRIHPGNDKKLLFIATATQDQALASALNVIIRQSNCSQTPEQNRLIMYLYVLSNVKKTLLQWEQLRHSTDVAQLSQLSQTDLRCLLWAAEESDLSIYKTHGTIRGKRTSMHKALKLPASGKQLLDAHVAQLEREADTPRGKSSLVFSTTAGQPITLATFHQMLHLQWRDRLDWKALGWKKP